MTYTTDDDALINNTPKLYKLDPNCEKYFWNRVVVIFNMNEGNYPVVIKHSIDNSSGIRGLLIRAGWRYTYMGKYCPNSEFVRQFIILRKRVKDENNNRQFIGGNNINGRAIKDISS